MPKTYGNITDIRDIVKKRSRVVRFFAIARAAIALTLAGVLIFMLYTYRESLTVENMRLFISNIAGGASSGEQFALSYDSGEQYGYYKGAVFALSGDGLRFYSGEETVSEPIPLMYQKPRMDAGSKFILAYDRDMGKMAVISNDTIVKTIQTPGTIVTARQNDSGYFAVVDKQDGYRSVVTIYNSGLQEIYRWYSARNWILACDIAPGNRKMIVSAIDTGGENIESSAMFFSFDNEAPIAQKNFGKNVAMDVCFKDDNLAAVLCQNSLTMFDGNGTQQSEYVFEEQLLAYNISGLKNSVLVFDDGKGSSDCRMVVVDNSGKETASYSLPARPVKMLCGDEYIVFLLRGQILFVGYDGVEKEIIRPGKSVRDIVMSDSGGIYMIGLSWAEYVSLK